MTSDDRNRLLQLQGEVGKLGPGSHVLRVPEWGLRVELDLPPDKKAPIRVQWHREPPGDKPLLQSVYHPWADWPADVRKDTSRVLGFLGL